jgi:hypothetical protein
VGQASGEVTGWPIGMATIGWLLIWAMRGRDHLSSSQRGR